MSEFLRAEITAVWLDLFVCLYVIFNFMDLVKWLSASQANEDLILSFRLRVDHKTFNIALWLGNEPELRTLDLLTMGHILEFVLLRTGNPLNMFLFFQDFCQTFLIWIFFLDFLQYLTDFDTISRKCLLLQDGCTQWYSFLFFFPNLMTPILVIFLDLNLLLVVMVLWKVDA